MGSCPECHGDSWTNVNTTAYDELHASRAQWIRAFNRLEKAVTNHIRDCIDSDGLAHAHGAVMRDLGRRDES